MFPGNETLEVVGESRHQDALWEIVGGLRRDPVRRLCDAVLMPEPTIRLIRTRSASSSMDGTSDICLATTHRRTCRA